MSTQTIDQRCLLWQEPGDNTLEITYSAAAGRLLYFAQEMLRGWLLQDPQRKPQDAVVEIDTSDHNFCRISIHHRGAPA